MLVLINLVMMIWVSFLSLHIFGINSCLVTPFVARLQFKSHTFVLSAHILFDLYFILGVGFMVHDIRSCFFVVL